MLSREGEATVLFVADSCFSGGTVRSSDPRVPAGSRLGRAGLIRAGAGDAVAERVRALGEVDASDLGRVIRMYGQDDDRVVREVAVGGRPRGALSHVVSRALRGEADGDGDGVLAAPELKRFVQKGVLRLTERRQRSFVEAGSPDLSISLAPAGPSLPPTSGAPELRIHFAGGRTPFRLEGTTEVEGPLSADLVYSAADRTLVHKAGDVVARFDPEQGAADLGLELQGAVDKWRLLEMLRGLRSSGDPDIELSDGDRIYAEGETVEFVIASGAARTAVLFNLAQDGTVQLLSDAGGDRLGAGRPRKFAARVMEPFGADHLVAVTTAGAAGEVFNAVDASHGRRDGALLARDLARILSGAEFGVNWVGLYTKEGGGA